MYGEEFSLSVALAPHRLQYYSKLYTKVCIVKQQLFCSQEDIFTSLEPLSICLIRGKNLKMKSEDCRKKEYGDGF